MAEDAVLPRLGLLGAGVLGSHILRRAQEEQRVRVVGVYDADPKRTRGLPPSLIVQSIRELATRGADLVVEVATPDALHDAALEILASSDLLPCSLTAFADDSFHRRVLAEQARLRHRVFIPHGAVGGLDGIYDGRHLIEQISITTTKPPHSLEGAEGAGKGPVHGLLFEGSTREACRLFPRNVNVHAAVALAGLGFDRTLSRVIADPDTATMRHCICVRGGGFDWELSFASVAGSGVTGSYAPESVYQSVLRAAGKGDVLQLPERAGGR